MADFADDIEFRKDGIMQTRAKDVLDQSISFLEQINEKGLFNAIEQRLFAEVARPKNGGKGLDGVYEKTEGYYNPMYSFLARELKIN
jgi:beta-lysine 5,6-aminomutase alpha subunit